MPQYLNIITIIQNLPIASSYLRVIQEGTIATGVF